MSSGTPVALVALLLVLVGTCVGASGAAAAVSTGDGGTPVVDAVGPSASSDTPEQGPWPPPVTVVRDGNTAVRVLPGGSGAMLDAREPDVESPVSRVAGFEPSSLDERAWAGTGVGGGPAPGMDGNSVERSNTTFVVTVLREGDARWRVTTSFNLTSDVQVETFKSLASSYEAGETTSMGLSAFRTGASLASAATGREMAISDPQRSSTLPSDTPGTATLELSFTWTNFARTDNGTVHVGDAFNTTDRWLDGLEPNQRLELRPPRGYTVLNSPAVPWRNRSLVWTGPATFDGTDVWATFSPNGPNGPGTTPGPDEGFDGGDLPLMAFGGMVVGAFVLVGYWVVQRRPDEPTVSVESADDGSVGADAGAEAAGAASGAAADDATDEDDGDLDDELLSDEERVERLLDDNGGRMKQANIVKETGWSNAKVSQLLSAMEEEDRIDKLRIGRENLISFPDEDVADVEE
jgi:uncharacterized membrane protein